MLYFRILKQGLTKLPSADPILRARFDKEVQARGSEALHQRLKRVDPVAALRIHPNDPQRLQRALEVYELTGIPISEHHTRQRKLVMDYRLIKLALIPHDRGMLHQTIASRFKQMLKRGLINEVEALYERKDLSPDLPAIRAVGYRQVWSYLHGNCEYADMVYRAIVATRQLAKRQLTWLRSEQEVKRLTMETNSVDQVVRKISAYV
jgi:tRNA dimethylallyltransferase